MAGNNHRQGQSSQQSQSAGASEPTPLQLTMEDRLNIIRRVPIIDVDIIPLPPEEFQPFTPEEPAPNFIFFADSQYAETLDALQDLGGRGDELQRDLGPECPPPEAAARVVADMIATRAALYQARRLVDYLETKDAVNRADAFVLLNRVGTSLTYHMQFHTALGAKYPLVMELIRDRKARIKEGRERARKTRRLTSDLQNAQKLIHKAGLVAKPQGSSQGTSGEGDNGSGSAE